MTKLYYDNLFDASYMAGTYPELKWVDCTDERIYMIHCDGHSIEWYHEKTGAYYDDEYYLRSDSHAFFEPKEGDSFGYSLYITMLSIICSPIKPKQLLLFLPQVRRKNKKYFQFFYTLLKFN